jgi:hypothetical protein
MRPKGYKLSETRFDQIIPRELVRATGIEYRRTAVLLTHRNHCKFMVARGMCTEDCKNCQEALTGAFKGIDPKVVRSPEAVLIFRLRVARERLIEQHMQDEKTHSDVGNFSGSLDTLEALVS